jgi:hypothetical protein
MKEIVVYMIANIMKANMFWVLVIYDFTVNLHMSPIKSITAGFRHGPGGRSGIGW